jgi:Tfp pilus assembly protein PilN
MASQRTGERALGIVVSTRPAHAIQPGGEDGSLHYFDQPQTVSAVLVERGANGPVVVRRFSRNGSVRMSPGVRPSFAAAPAGSFDMPEESGAQDYTLQFGDGAGSRDLFLNSEFSGSEAVKAAAESTEVQKPQSFALELSDVLAECRDAGYAHLPLAFVIGNDDVQHVELLVEPKKGLKPGEKKKAEKTARSRLLDVLQAQHGTVHEPDRVAFIPMVSTDEGTSRFLALIPAKEEAIVETLRGMRKQKVQPTPLARRLDSETSLILGMARQNLTGVDDDTYSVVIRASRENTLVMILRGTELLHCETLFSLTAFDAAGTICSRVLLLLDEHGVGDVHRIFVASEHHEVSLVDGVSGFFSGGHVLLLSSLAPPVKGDMQLTADEVNAAVAAARLVDADTTEEVNLLPKELMKRVVEIPMHWPAIVIGVLLFLSLGVFTVRYLQLEAKIAEQQVALASFSETLIEYEPRVLQMRIDSLKAAQQSYTAALTVLDTLLVGSDRWSRTLEQVAQNTASVRGIWVDNWRPQNGYLVLTGNANSRDRVVTFADNVGAEIESLIFSEIRDWTVYTFVVRMPLPNELPLAAQYLRDNLRFHSNAQLAAEN